MLIISVILQLEQRKGNRKEPESKKLKVPGSFLNIPGSVNTTTKVRHREYRKRRDDLC